MNGQARPRAAWRPHAGRQVVSREPLHRRPMARPYVLKPVNEGSSVGVAIVTAEGNYGNPIGRDVEGPWQEFETLLAEPFVRGRELTVAVLGGEPLAVTELKPLAGFYDYAAKYTDGLTEQSARPTCPTTSPRGCRTWPRKPTDSSAARARRAPISLGRRGWLGWPLSPRNQHAAGMTPLSLVPEQAKQSRHCLWRAGRTVDRRARLTRRGRQGIA